MLRVSATTAIRALLVSAGVVAAIATAATSQQTPPVSAREDAYRANNIGVSRLEQFDYTAAAAAFQQALKLDPAVAMARVNLGLAHFYAGDMEAAERELTAARPGVTSPHADYILGLVARRLDRVDDALAAFLRVRAVDPADVGTAVNLGQIYIQLRRFPEAIAMFREAVAAEPFNATAAYGLATALLRAGDDTEGTTAMTRFERLRESAFAVTYAETYFGQGRYTEAISSTGAEAGLVDSAIPAVTFIEAADAMPRTGDPRPGIDNGSVALVDLDADGDLDLAASGDAGLRLYRNDNGRLVDVTASLLPAAASAPASAIVAADYDNDGATDLAVLRPGGLTLLRRDRTAGFTDVSADAGVSLPVTPVTAAWVDADHDGDADLFVGLAAVSGGSGARLFRNNGNGRFTDITSDAALVISRPVAAVVPTDFDNRRDIDLLVVAAGGAPLLFRNMREGTFSDVAAEAGLAVDSTSTMAAAGDVNKDGYPDFFFIAPAGPGTFAMSDGRGRFTTTRAPAPTAGARAAQFVDYDHDGLLDLFVLTASGPALLRNIGTGWSDVTTTAIGAPMAAALTSAGSLATGDVDGDGHIDIVVPGSAGPVVWRNSGSRAASVRVVLTARVSNRSAAGAKIEMRAGSLQQRHEVYAATPAPASADILFGLGDRQGADVLRVLWPSGILQAETSPDAATPIAGRLTIEELDRKPSSCPFLFTWNGERFEFVTDFLGGGEMGAWLAPGVRNSPDPDEYVRIAGDRLKPRNGKYELHITNELEEALFLDRVQLIAVAHPSGVEIHPNEGLGSATTPFTIYTTRGAQPPIAASDDQGRDVLAELRAIDRHYVNSFALASVRGYAAEHSLTLTLPRPGPGGRRVLLMTGWTDYAFSGDNVAAHQAGLPAIGPTLEVKNPDGTWSVAGAIGMPVGRPQTVVVDLKTLVPAAANEVRIRTSLRIYWDQVLVDTSDGKAPHTLSKIDPDVANLGWRGYSAESTPDGREPYGYDFDRVSTRARWKQMPGKYTREGDVRDLLLATDDMFVVSQSGDRISLSFEASSLPALPQGWTRTFLLYADGFSKEMNIHSASPDQLLPLPFHGMSKYPYDAPEAYPSTPAHRRYLERYNTREVRRTLPLDSGLVTRSN